MKGFKRLIPVVLACMLWQQPVWAFYHHHNETRQASGLVSRFYSQAAIQLASQGDFKGASTLLQAVVQMQPHQLNAIIWYTDFLRAQGDYKTAIAACEEAASRWADDPKTQSMLYFRLSLLLDENKQTLRAIEALQQAKAVYPGDPLMTYDYDLGVLYAKLNRYDQTLIYSQKAVDRDPTSAAAWNNLGYSLAQLGRFDAGYQAIEKSLHLEPGNANTLDSMGYVLFGLKRYKEAQTYYEQAIQHDPGLTESYLFLGKTYEALQNWTKAIEAYERFQRLTIDMAESDRVGRVINQIKMKQFLIENQPTESQKPPAACPTATQLVKPVSQ